MIAPVSSTEPKSAFPRLPAVVICIGFLLGILIDSSQMVSPIFWLASACLLTLCIPTLLFLRIPRMATLALLLFWVSLGGARHHLFWWGTTENDLGHLATDGPKSIRVQGTVNNSPIFRPALERPLRSTTPAEDRTSFPLGCSALIDAKGQPIRSVSGQVHVNIAGSVPELRAGQTIALRGLLFLAEPPGNPGEFDYGEYLKRNGCSATLSIAHPDAVSLLAEPEWWEIHWQFLHGLKQLRDQAEAILKQSVSAENFSIASALLIGNRTAMTPDQRQAFVESGTLHVLAISGLHVGILVGVLLLFVRLARISPLISSLCICAIVIMYAMMTEGRPSVVRATVLICLILIARPHAQPVRMLNSLAVAGLLLLLWNPSDLFHTGAQLSFLAVLGILRFSQWQSQQTETPPATEEILDDLEERPWWNSAWKVSRNWFVQAFLLMATIWVFTLPLVAARFHIVSIVGLFLNVFLVPLIALILWCGYLVLGVGFIFPFALPLVSWTFDFGLSMIRSTVVTAGNWNIGHLYLPGPENWWLWGYYLLLLLWSLNAQRRILPLESVRLNLISRRLKTERWCAVIWSGWLILGLAAGLTREHDNQLRCTFIAVGHGNAILFECPNGKTLLYDAGSLQDGYRASQVIQEVLWSRGIGHLDGLVVSHADLDHFNAVPDLLTKIPIGSFFLSPQQMRQRSESNLYLLDTIQQSNLPLQTVSFGDQLQLDPSVQFTIVHPQQYDQFETDNQNSLVLQIQYAGRTILLTGDLEDTGLQLFLRNPPRKVDTLLAPHHGSLNVDHPGLARWCEPGFVIISGGTRNALEKMQSIYSPPTNVRSTRNPTVRSTVISTVQSGAVTVTISRSGKLQVETFLKNSL